MFALGARVWRDRSVRDSETARGPGLFGRLSARSRRCCRVRRSGPRVAPGRYRSLPEGFRVSRRGIVLVLPS